MHSRTILVTLAIDADSPEAAIGGAVRHFVSVGCMGGEREAQTQHRQHQPRHYHYHIRRIHSETDKNSISAV